MFYKVRNVRKINESNNKIIKKLVKIKAPLYTKLILMDCGISNTNLLGSSSSGLGYDCFYMKSTDGATMYFNFGEWHWKRENSNWLLSEIKRERWKIILPSMGFELTTSGLWVQRSTNWAIGETYKTLEK